MTWNSGKPGTAEAEILRSAEQAIRSALPATWSVKTNHQPPPDSHRAYRPDAQLTITAPDGTEAEILIEHKVNAEPRIIASVAKQLRAHAAAAAQRETSMSGAMLAAPFVSPTARVLLEEHGLGWFDTTGNLRLRIDSPAVFLDRTGAERSELRDPADRLLKSLRGPGAAKVVLELCETALPVGVRDLAKRSQVGVATSARVLELLDREATIVRSEDGAVTSVRKHALLKRWTQDYKVMRSNSVMTTLDPRGLGHALNGLSSLRTRVTVTGSAAVRAYLPEEETPISPVASVSLYAEDPFSVMAQLGLKTVERGANVLIMRPYDNVVHSKSRLVGGTWFAAPAQVAADLLTGPGRSTEEAEQLIAALRKHEQGWGK